MFYLFANWKSHNNLSQTREWFGTFINNLDKSSRNALENEQMMVVIFPQAPLTYPLHTLCMGEVGISVGFQDISPLDEGKYTGLVNASSAEGIANFVIVGHVEQRQRGDSIEIVAQKYKQALNHGIRPVLCISKIEQIIQDAQIIAFEPIEAIGSGHNALMSEISNFKKSLNRPKSIFIYGGSVDETNCVQYIDSGLVDGLLIGTVSLDAIRFSTLVNACASYVNTKD